MTNVSLFKRLISFIIDFLLVFSVFTIICILEIHHFFQSIQNIITNGKIIFREPITNFWGFFWLALSLLIPTCFNLVLIINTNQTFGMMFTKTFYIDESLQTPLSKLKCFSYICLNIILKIAIISLIFIPKTLGIIFYVVVVINFILICLNKRTFTEKFLKIKLIELNNYNKIIKKSLEQETKKAISQKTKNDRKRISEEIEI